MRPTSTSVTLALCSVAAGLLAFVLVIAGWTTPAALLAGVAVGTGVYMAILLTARRRR